jgi:transposase
VYHERDLNAAINLRGLATKPVGSTGSSPESDACGEERLQP